jgi:hypothetical protein
MLACVAWDRLSDSVIVDRAESTVRLVKQTTLPVGSRIGWVFHHNPNMARIVHDAGVIYPLGVNTFTAYVVGFESYRCDSGSLAFAILSSNKRLVICLSRDDFWTIDLSVSIDLLVDPKHVYWWVRHHSLLSLFITDSVSCRVCEIRFESDIFDSADHDFCLLYWFLESGIPISDSTAVTLVSSETDLPNLQIIGKRSNADSQGIVRLVNASGIPTSPRATVPTSFPSFIGLANDSTLIVNVPGEYLKIFTVEDGFDFPIFTRRSVDAVEVVRSDTDYWMALLVRGDITVYQGSDLRSPFPILDKVGVLSDVRALAGGYRDGSVSFTIYRESEIVLASIDTGDYSLAVVARVPIQDIAQVCVRDSCWPVGNELFQISNSSPKLLLTTVSEIDRFAITDSWIAVGIVGNGILLYPWDGSTVSSPPISAPLFCHGVNQFPFRFTSVAGKRILEGFPGGLLLVESFDPVQGVYWKPVGGDSTGILSACISELNMYFVESGGYRVGSSPRNPCEDSFDRAVAERYRKSFDPAYDILSTITPELSRTSDTASRRYSLKLELGAEITFEELAWYWLSDFSGYDVLRTGTTWEQLRRAGIGYLPLESGESRALAEQIQKSVLQEYLRSKDESVLESGVALWLAMLGGKQQLLVSLFKQLGNSCASPAHLRVAQFLASDLCGENREKAIKNAFELIRQKRYKFAVAVFLLAGQVREAIDVCCRQLEDVQLALFICQVARTSDDTIWTEKLIPLSDYDLWVCLMYYGGIKGDVDECVGRVSLPAIRVNGGTPPLPSSLGPFASPNVFVSRLSAEQFVATLVNRLKRLNKLPDTYQSEVPGMTSEEKECMYRSCGIE